MFLVDKLAKPLSNRISFSDVTGTFSEAIKGVQENIAAKDKIVTLCDHSTRNQKGTNPTMSNIRGLNVSSYTGSGNEVTVLYDLPAAATLVSYDVNPQYGVATVNKAAGSTEMTFTGGYGATIANIKLSDGTHYPCQEGGGEFLYDVSGNGNHARINRRTDGSIGAYWTSQVDDNVLSESWNNDNGFTIAAELTGDVCGWDTGFSSNDLDRYEIKIMSRYDDAGEGDFVIVDGGGQVNGVQQGRPTLYCTGGTVSGSDASLGKRVVLYKGFVATGESGALFHIQNSQTGGSGLVGTYFWDWTDPDNPTGGLDTKSYDYPFALNPHDAHIFIGNRSTAAGSSQRFDQGHFYYFKGYKNGELKCHIVPTLEGRLKDVVNGNLLTAAVGGAATVPIIRIPMMKNKTTQVLAFDGVDDYIETQGDALPLADKEVVEVKFKVTSSGNDRQTLWAQGDFDAVESQGGLSLVYDKVNRRLRARIGTGTGGSSSYHQVATPNFTLQHTPTDGQICKATLTYDRAAARLEIRQETQGFMANTGTVNTVSTTIPSTALPPTTYTKKIRIGRGSASTAKLNCLIYNIKCTKFNFDFTTDIGTAVLQDKTPVEVDVNGDFSNDGSGWTPFADTMYGYTGSARSTVGEGFAQIVTSDENADGTIMSHSAIDGIRRYNTLVVGRKYRLTVQVGAAKYGGLMVDGSNVYIIEKARSGQTYTLEFTATTTTLGIKRNQEMVNGSKLTDVFIHNIKLEDLDGQDAAVVNGQLRTIWGKRIYDANGEIVSADYAYNTLEPTHPSGYVHNNNEAAITFITTGTTTVEKTKAQLDAHVNGTNNLYISREGDYITRLVQYDTTYTLTAKEQEINNNFFS